MATHTAYGAASSQQTAMRSLQVEPRWCSVRHLTFFPLNSLKVLFVVYDLLADKRTVKIRAHKDDINSCCWADTASGNVLVSASDDTFLKVWYACNSFYLHAGTHLLCRDRRSLGSSPKPSGVLMGHTEGITYVSAKGDGRYLISNGKDQKLRLWDIRKMRSNLEFEQYQDRDFGISGFDYRRGSYPQPRYEAHPMDCSVMQYTGHDVLRTLIRCHFSPAETTGQQYIYSGSADGRIHVRPFFNLVTFRHEYLPMYTPPDLVTRRNSGRGVRSQRYSTHVLPPIRTGATTSSNAEFP